MGQGDFKEEEFSKEELTALGEAEAAPAAEKAEQEEAGPEPEANPEGEVTPEVTPEAEQGEEAPAEEEPAEEVKDPIQKRFDRLTWEKHETERKLDLFKKLGPEGYYQAYPEERPEAPVQPEPRREMIPPGTDIGGLIVKQPNGPYDGMTLRDVYQQDPVFATNLQTDFLLKQKEVMAEKRNEWNRTRQDAATEIETFAESVAKESFGKSVKTLSKDEEGAVVNTIQAVLDFMTKTNRGSGLMDDAYFLMNKEGLLKGAAEKAAFKTLKDLQGRKGPASIDTGSGGEAKATGFEAMEKMTEADLTAKIDKMSDKDAAKFFKAAPKALRAKYPGLPWD